MHWLWLWLRLRLWVRLRFTDEHIFFDAAHECIHTCLAHVARVLNSAEACGTGVALDQQQTTFLSVLKKCINVVLQIPFA